MFAEIDRVNTEPVEKRRGMAQANPLVQITEDDDRAFLVNQGTAIGTLQINVKE
jgi:hypothetical protein